MDGRHRTGAGGPVRNELDELREVEAGAAVLRRRPRKLRRRGPL